MSASTEHEDLPFVLAAAAGTAAWLFGYVFTYLLVGRNVRESGLHRFVEAFEGDPAHYELVGWVFYNAHFVDVVYAGFGGRLLPPTYVGREEGFSYLLYAVPPALLVAAGLTVGRYRGVAEPNDGGVAGALVVPGYLVLAVAGVVLFEVSAAGTTGRPDPPSAFVLAGVVYPVAIGGLGGAIAAYTVAEPRPGGGTTS